MTTLLYSHPACQEHDPGAGHPECPERLAAVLAGLDGEAFAALERREAPLASHEQIARVHDPRYVTAVLEAIPDSGRVALDADTVASPDSGQAALRGAGAVCAAVDAVMAGEAANGFCAVRPPGHHAEPARAMGFCFFNNVAIGAAHARAKHGLDKVAVIDFDVHHGNGTQAMFWDQPEMFFGSTHQMPLYPGSGAESERGAQGNIVNAPLAPMAGSEAFRAAMSARILPALDAFAPEFILISAGFDAHTQDPLASLNFQDQDYGWATSEILKIAANRCDGRLVSTLEGGYHLDALARSCAAHVTALMAA
ncbi:MAG: histone deacetylase family protein [Pseudomonadota bacterium]